VQATEPAALPQDRPKEPIAGVFDAAWAGIKGVVNGVIEGIGRGLEGLGKLLGAKEKPSDTSTDGVITPVRPNPNGDDGSGKKPVLFVNGAGTSQAASVEAADSLSKWLGGRNVDLVHNATEIPQYDESTIGGKIAQAGAMLAHFERDKRQVMSDYDRGPNAATDTLRDTIVARLRDGNDRSPIEIVGASQGTVISRAAILAAMDAQRDHYASWGMSGLALEAALQRDLDRIHYASIAPAVKREDFPQGLSNYLELYHPNDSVVTTFGPLRGDISAEEYLRRGESFYSWNLNLEHGAILHDAGMQDNLRSFFARA
jgi:hypothetical protein